jgi:hypothetical protein
MLGFKKFNSLRLFKYNNEKCLILIGIDLHQPSNTQSLSFVRESTPLSLSQKDSMPADLTMYVLDQTIIPQIEKKSQSKVEHFSIH